MFSSSPYYNSGGGSGISSEDMIYFKDPESSYPSSNTYLPSSDEEPLKFEYANNERDGIRKNPFLKNNTKGYKSNNSNPFNSMKGVGKSSESNTDISNDYDEKLKFHISIESTQTRRKHLIIQSYFKTFEILTALTFLLFLCPLISIILESSCTSENDFCLPRFEIQTSGSVDREYSDNLYDGMFSMQLISKDLGTKDLSTIEKLTNGLSTLILDTPLSVDVIRNVLEDVFENELSVIYKFSDFGFCKQYVDGDAIETECHTFYKYGLDIPSVLIRDLIYSMAEGDSEEVSDLFFLNYKRIFNILSLNPFSFQKYKSENSTLFYTFLSLNLNKFKSILGLIEFSIDLISLMVLISVVIVLKGKISGKLLHKDYLFDNNFQRAIEEENQKTVMLEKILKVVSTLIILSLLFKIIGIIYIIVYESLVVKNLHKFNINLINGIKMISDGTILELVNIVIHLIISIGLMKCIKYKPWMVSNI